MEWLKSYGNLAHHPKTHRLMSKLQISRPEVIGHLNLLWHWALEYANDGDLSRYDAGEIAIAAEWQKEPGDFLNALNAVGFVDRDGDECRLHDWDDWAGKEVAALERKKRDQQRRRDAERTAQSDVSHQRSGIVPESWSHEDGTKSNRGGVVPLRGEKRREEEKREDLLISSSDEERDSFSLSNDGKRSARKTLTAEMQREFMEFWSAYPYSYRKNKEKSRQAYAMSREEHSHAEIMEGVTHLVLPIDQSGFFPFPDKWLSDESFVGAKEAAEANAQQKPKLKLNIV